MGKVNMHIIHILITKKIDKKATFTKIYTVLRVRAHF